YYQQAGISAPDILRLATLGSAEVMGLQESVGRIAPGQRADLFLVPGEPDRDIADIEQVNWVMKGGEIIDPAALYRAISIRPPGAEGVGGEPREH
ncbi:MAG TPA: amidohydrolase family protein, partial [Woeseiaceae bacterium]|nr:amidohydrolase family protein [Woeseiaceae bacterium]